MEPPLPFTVRVDSRNGVARIALGGELDVGTVPVLKEHVARVEGDSVVAIMLDLRDLEFVDASGVHAFLAARKRSEANGHRFALIGAGRMARRLFELTGTASILDGEDAVGLLDRFTGTRLGGS